MIACVEGIVDERSENACVVRTAGGVGYEVNLPSQTLSKLPERGATIRLYTCLITREDAQELFGFESWEERQTFLILVSISKVGARTALAILSTFRPSDLRSLVVEDDALLLTQVPGIGKKTAQHIFLELKYKLKAENMPVTGTGSSAAGGVFKDALQGLASLGYTENEAIPALKSVLQEEPDLNVSEALRATLKALAREKAGK